MDAEGGVGRFRIQKPETRVQSCGPEEKNRQERQGSDQERMEPPMNADGRRGENGQSRIQSPEFRVGNRR